MRVINFDKGSKRRLRNIRWTRSEIVSVVLLSLITLVLCVSLGIWEASREPAQPWSPQVGKGR
jgi:hypothetical protein